MWKSKSGKKVVECLIIKISPFRIPGTRLDTDAAVLKFEKTTTKLGDINMALVKWDPFRDVAELQTRINRMFDDSFGSSRDREDDMNVCAWTPAVDIYETETGVILAVELPGVGKENVAIEVKDNILTLKGERFAKPEIKKEAYYRLERCYGTFQRSFTLHHNIQPNLIKATFKDGMLEIEIPRPDEEQPKKITVEVE